MIPQVVGLGVHPVKGLSRQPLIAVALRAGAPFPGDRRFALARRALLDRPGVHPAEAFHMLLHRGDTRLAGLRTEVDDGDRMRVFVRDSPRDHLVLDVSLRTAAGRREVEDLYSEVLDLTKAERPVLVDTAALGYTDLGAEGRYGTPALHLLNLASVRDLAERTATTIDPDRFRANMHVDGLPAWAEREWTGLSVTVSGVRMRVGGGTERCAATEVAPASGARDLPVPRLLTRAYGHTEMGVYATVTAGGTVRLGDVVTVDDLR